MRAVSFFAVSFLLLQGAFAQSDWSLKKSDEHGIEIYTRTMEGSNYKEYKITTHISTAPANILKELLDAPEYNEDPEPGVSYYVKERAPHEHLFYVKKKLPWPIKDRDLVTLITVNKVSEEKIILTMEGLPEGLPAMKNAVRIKTLMGKWTLEAADNGTRTTQQLFVDPEGALPPFITNAMLTKGPYKTFLELKKVADKYNSSQLGS